MSDKTVLVEIKSRWTGAVKFSAQVDASLSFGRRLGAAVKLAFESGADLTGAVLRDAVLRGADLTGAVLTGADLTDADLTGADLTGAVLTDADLTDADLTGAVLTGAYGFALPEPEDAERRIRAVAEAALASPGALAMDGWHKCETAHCIAGWAIHLAGDAGYILERVHGSHMAGLMLLGAEAHKHFYDSNDDARKWLESKLVPVAAQPQSEGA